MQRAYKCLAVVCFSLMSLGTSVPAQSPTVKCPTLIRVECPTVVLNVGQPFIVTAKVTDADPSWSLTYNWSVSAGIITGGQGTPSITIDTTGTDGETITTTLEVGGLDSTCANSASCTHVAAAAPVSRRFDKFGDLAFADEKKRLDYFAEQLQNEPDSMASILVYGKQGARTPEAQARADRAKDYLVNKRGIAAERITTIDGGVRPRLQIELWLTPQGGTAPQPEEQEQ